MFLTVFPPFYAQERIAPLSLCSVALYKRATLSDSLFFTSESLARKQTSDLLKKPMSKFPTL